MPTDVELAWAAGFIDGEGSIRATKNSHNSDAVVLRVQVAQVDPRPLQALVDMFGGSVTGPYFHKNVKHRKYYAYARVGSNAVTLLRQILPYLKTKQEEAQLGIDFWEYNQTVKNPGRRGTSPEVQERRNSFVTELKEMKNRGS